MPLQWLPLQQRQQAASPVSEALRPRPVQGPVGGGFAAAGGRLPNTFVEEQKAKWAEEDKLRKLERDSQTQRAQEIGMRTQVGAQQQRQASMAQMQQQGAASTLPKEKVPETAKTTWEFISTLEPESQKFYINQLKQKEYGGAASTISLTNEPYDPETDTVIEDPQSRQMFVVDKSGKKKMVILQGGSGMYAEMIKQGLLNPSDDTVIEKERVFEKGTFTEDKEGNLINTATGETVVRAGDIPTGLNVKEISDGFNYGRQYMASLMEPTIIEKISKDEMAGHIERGRAEAKLQTELYLTGILRGKGMSKEQAEKEAKKIAYNMSDEDLGIEGDRGGKGRQKPLDESIVKDLAAHLKLTPDADIEAYRNEYGDATVDKALELNRGPEPTPEPIPMPKPKPEPIVKEEKKIKDYFGVKKYSPL